MLFPYNKHLPKICDIWIFLVRILRIAIRKFCICVHRFLSELGSEENLYHRLGCSQWKYPLLSSFLDGQHLSLPLCLSLKVWHRPLFFPSFWRAWYPNTCSWIHFLLEFLVLLELNSHLILKFSKLQDIFKTTMQVINLFCFQSIKNNKFGWSAMDNVSS